MRHAFGASFDVPTGYLNTPSIGIPPTLTTDAVRESVTRWGAGADHPADFDEHVRRARAAFAKLVGVDADNVAAGASGSQLAGIVAASVPDGSRVLVARGEFTSLTFPFAAQAHRGVKVTEVELADIPSEVDGHDLVAVSVVQSANGAEVDLAALREAATGTRVLLDATQAVGWMPLDLAWADWVVAAAYKWMLCPRGAAWLAVRPDALDELVVHSANWYAGEDPWQSIYGLPLRLARNARRLDLSPVWLAQVGATASLEYLSTLDLAEVRAHSVRLTDALLAELDLPGTGSAIVSLELNDEQARRLSEAGVRSASRAGRTRLGFHLYNNAEDVDLVVRTLKR
ncbi:aminotransferase class V-fold PLP-dependent enzyme [Allokutzneria sp. A3M-2-11 16]|uniref:aminotransferase class V-fold PLP-dependent enzyme n=1 Tax=Allokutzneria sp. A3M-2-11 16 TaxID=2962043 RepID=UPI0020B7CE03|nr:aminotransferase class V-fold PLP-dependent enzyme [Allokutzneria sp. A3M-2-11 16]MCP3797855.1 aminotransferase class V-fold PLP-dependent enzyme [Allokutzneria sp. A3M-2-11 16]